MKIYRFSSPSLFDQKNPRRVDWTINEGFLFYFAGIRNGIYLPLNFAIYQWNHKKPKFRKTFSISLWTLSYFSYSLTTMNHPRYIPILVLSAWGVKFHHFMFSKTQLIQVHKKFEEVFNFFKLVKLRVNWYEFGGKFSALRSNAAMRKNDEEFNWILLFKFLCDIEDLNRHNSMKN